MSAKSPSHSNTAATPTSAPPETITETRISTPRTANPTGDIASPHARAKRAVFNSHYNVGQCLPGTRTGILSDIASWWCEHDDDNDTADILRVYWLSGGEGTGKATIARTVDGGYTGEGVLAARFAFPAGGAGETVRGRGLGVFCEAVVTELGTRIQGLEECVRDAVNDDANIWSKSAGEQWGRIVVEPLRKLLPGTVQGRRVVVLIIEAVDECSDVELLVKLLAQLSAIESIRLRVLLTSRKKPRQVLEFDSLSKKIRDCCKLRDVSDDRVEEDVDTVLREEMRNIRVAEGLPAEWPGDEKIQRMCEMAGNSFIYAVTACKLIRAALPVLGTERALEMVMENSDGGGGSGEVDGLYTAVLKHAAAELTRYDQGDAAVEKVMQVAGAVVGLLAPLSVAALAEFIALDLDTVRSIATSLSPVFRVEEDADGDDTRVYLRHSSFRTFLHDLCRLESQSRLDSKDTHHSLLLCCLESMALLNKDICNLRDPGVLVSQVRRETIYKFLPSHVRYSCRFWTEHLRQSHVSLRDGDGVYEFLKTKLLHWVEALGWMGMVADGIQALQVVKDVIFIRSEPGSCNELRKLVYDGTRFLLHNHKTIATCPLQTYVSAVVFAPSRVRESKHFSANLPRWIKVLPAVREDWSPVLHVLEEHAERVHAVAFFPDGRTMASSSRDGTVRIWDTVLGVEVAALRGDSATEVSAIAISRDGKLLAAGYEDGIIRLWDPATGAEVAVLRGHTDAVAAVVFTGNGSLASGSADITVRVWELETGAERAVLEGHVDEVCALAFSSATGTLASGSWDNTIRLWNLTTGAHLATLEGHDLSVYAIAFSPDGSILASGSRDDTIRLWNPTTGAEMAKLEAQQDPSEVYSIAFSPDGKILASGTRGGNVRLWNPTLGTEIATLQGHLLTVSALAFSPDGKTFASGSWDCNVRLWDMAIATSSDSVALQSHFDTTTVYTLTFSPDGKLLASGASDNLIHLWDPSTGSKLATLHGHTDTVYALAFSGDGTTLASGSWDSTIRVWDVATRSHRTTLQGHSLDVYTVVFSPDGKTLASGSDDSTVRLWSLATGDELAVLQVHADAVDAVAFSHDGRMLASGSDDGTIRLWDASTYAHLATLEGHTSDVKSVAFSSTGRFLASGSSDNTVRFWDVATRTQIHSVATDARVTRIVFCAGDRGVETNQGVIGAPSAVVGGGEEGVGGAWMVDRWAVNGGWVEFAGRRVLEVRGEVRPRCSAVFEGCVALGHEAGRVSSLVFEEGLGAGGVGGL